MTSSENHNAYNTQTISAYYYPFGMIQPGRSIVDPGGYRYGFLGQEMDDEVKGSKGSSVNYKYRMHDPRLGRFFAVDPLAPLYAWNSPYSFSENQVINAIELEGLEKEDLIAPGGNQKPILNNAKPEVPNALPLPPKSPTFMNEMELQDYYEQLNPLQQELLRDKLENQKPLENLEKLQEFLDEIVNPDLTPEERRDKIIEGQENIKMLPLDDFNINPIENDSLDVPLRIPEELKLDNKINPDSIPELDLGPPT